MLGFIMKVGDASRVLRICHMRAFAVTLVASVLTSFAPISLADQRETLEALCTDKVRAERIAAELDGSGVPSLPPGTDLAAQRERALDLQRDAKYDDARSLFYQVLATNLRAPTGNNQQIASDLASLAQLRRWSSKYVEVDALLHCVLTIRQALPAWESQPLTGAAFEQLAQYELVFGHLDLAEDYAHRSAKILRAAGDIWAGQLGAALTALANIRRERAFTGVVSTEQRDEFVRLYREALAANSRVSGCETACIAVATSMDNLANALAEVGPASRAEAKKFADDGLALKLRLVDPTNDSVATSVLTLARIAAADGLTSDAINLYRHATGILQLTAQKAQNGDLAILSRVAEATAEFGDFCERLSTREARPEAILQYTISVNARELMRVGANGLPDNYRSDLTRVVARPYHQLAGLLIREGRLVEAEHVIDLLKEEEFVGLFRGASIPTRSSVNAPSATLYATSIDAEYNELVKQWVANASELAKLERSTQGLNANKVQRLTELRLALQDRIDAYQRFLAKIASDAPSTSIEFTDARVTELGKKLKVDPDGALALHYVVTDREIGIIVVSPTITIAKLSNVPSEELRKSVAELRQAIKSQWILHRLVAVFGICS